VGTRGIRCDGVEDENGGKKLIGGITEELELL
jgi:hypothetical protein